MYAEVGNNFVDCSLFKEADGKLIYRDCGINLTEKLSEIWNNIDKDRRWLGISYSIYGNKFKTSFIFTKDVDSSEFYADRRPRIVEAHFGKMAIDYSDP